MADFRLAPQTFDPAIAVDRLHEHPKNPNRGADGAVAESLDEHGFYGAVIVQAGTGLILAGNTRYRNAVAAGAPELPGFWLDVDDDEAERILAIDNRSNRLGADDQGALAALMSGLAASDRGLSGTGYARDDIDAILASQDLELSRSRRPPIGPDEQFTDPPPAISQPGDVWSIGPHHVACTDSTDPDATAAALAAGFGEEQPACMWTDPPYGVSYQGFANPAEAKRARRRTDGLTITGDGEKGLPDLLDGLLAVAGQVLQAGSPWYISTPAGPLAEEFTAAVARAGWIKRQTLIWVKQSIVLGRSDYHYQHEPVLYGFTPGGKGRRGRGGPGWYGDNSQSSVFHINGPRSGWHPSDEHPTTKPAELVVRHLSNSTRPGSLVYDPCAGSGTTAVAASLTGRRAFLAEIDPRYCDVICRRLSRYLGVVPERIRGAELGPRSFAREGDK